MTLRKSEVMRGICPKEPCQHRNMDRLLTLVLFIAYQEKLADSHVCTSSSQEKSIFQKLSILKTPIARHRWKGGIKRVFYLFCLKSFSPPSAYVSNQIIVLVSYVEMDLLWLALACTHPPEYPILLTTLLLTLFLGSLENTNLNQP